MEVQGKRSEEKAVLNIRAAEEAAIRGRIRDYTEALKSKDVNRIIAAYSKDLVSFDIMPPLRVKGVEAIRKNYNEWFEGTKGAIQCDLQELEVVCSENIGSAFCLNHMVFDAIDGKKMDMWVRWTACFKKFGAQWLITHEHVSVPIDMETEKAIWNLTPDSVLKH